MNLKTIVIIIVSTLVTIVLMKNTYQIDFWFFGNTKISKPAILGLMFFIGVTLGFLLGRARKKAIPAELILENELLEAEQKKNKLSEEDRDYISWKLGGQTHQYF